MFTFLWTSNLFFALQAPTPRTPSWSLSIGAIMIICNLIAIAIGRFSIQNPGKGPEIPLLTPMLGDNFGVPELLATTSFGHVLGAGVILGLTNAGIL
ncbi:MAG: photosystem I reaction center subunit PsaK [Chloroflexaceae bacterium]|nr:photosystem I reaction center subunit PsaK [Chloroflexaceae bacterium]